MTRPSALSKADFMARFAGVWEHSPWIAEGAFHAGLTPAEDAADGLHAAMVRVMRAADRASQLDLIKAHPDLAGKLAAAKLLTAESADEQASAGLDRLTAAERARFTALNEAYKTRFGFPFILAVKGKTKDDIRSAMETRLENDHAAEFETALHEIERIALLRLHALLPT